MKTRGQNNHLGVKALNSVLPVILAFVIGGVIIAAIGENPLTAYQVMIQRSLFSVRGLTRTLQLAAPLLLSGMAIAICFKANIFNMGIEGQLIFGGFMAGIVGNCLVDMNPAAHKLICFAVGILCGMAFALIPALLRAYFHVDEMVVTLVLNYAMARVLEYLASVVFRDAGAGYVATPPVQDSAKFFLIGTTRLTPFLFISVIIFAVMAFVMTKTKLGYTITALGKNPSFAEATGLRSRRTIIVLMLISGALAGVAGTGQMLAEKTFYTLDFSGSPGLGWDGMLIALLGRHTPGGIVVAALFYSALKTGSEAIGLYANVPNEIVAVIQSLMILFLAIQFFDERYGLTERLKEKLAAQKAGSEEGRA